jgi:hypothetical protein
MGLASVFDTVNFVFNCFWSSKKQNDRYDKDDKDDKDIEMEILNIDTTIKLNNLYPTSDNVASWTVLAIGSDKSYVCAHFGDFKLGNTSTEKLLNNRGANVMPAQMNAFFDPIWTDTLKGKPLQFYISVNNRLFFVNTFPLSNDDKEVIGAIMFIRLRVSNRHSEERSRFSFETGG